MGEIKVQVWGEGTEFLTTIAWEREQKEEKTEERLSWTALFRNFFFLAKVLEHSTAWTGGRCGGVVCGEVYGETPIPAAKKKLSVFEKGILEVSELFQ